MSDGQPVDGQGRALPPCWWPEGRSAPGDLERLRRLCNTANLESGADRLDTARGLDRWLLDEGLPPVEADDRDHARLIACREAIRDAAVAHRTGGADREALARLGELAAGIAFEVQLSDGIAGLAPRPSLPAADRLIGELIAIAVLAQDTGPWRRLKACASCRWVFFDASKNRSGRWCSMRACGGRAKVRNHRARRRAPDRGDGR